MPNWAESDNLVWKEIIQHQRPLRKNQIVSLFEQGLKELEMDLDTIPDLESVNRILLKKTGWQGVYVKGLEDGPHFYSMLSQKKFPIGKFIRDKRDLNYTPEPDVVHDLYGHMPFFIDQAYADFCFKFANEAMKWVKDINKFQQFERIFWFTIEFGLVRDNQSKNNKQDRKIFGAGIASSIGECVYALSDKPEVIPFDIGLVSKQEFRIDEMQKRLFILDSVEQLYQSLNSFRPV